MDNHGKMCIFESSFKIEYLNDKGANDGNSRQKSCNSGGVTV